MAVGADTAAVVDLQALPPQVPDEHVELRIQERVPDVGGIVRRDPAHVDTHAFSNAEVRRFLIQICNALDTIDFAESTPGYTVYVSTGNGGADYAYSYAAVVDTRQDYCDTIEGILTGDLGGE